MQTHSTGAVVNCDVPKAIHLHMHRTRVVARNWILINIWSTDAENLEVWFIIIIIYTCYILYISYRDWEWNNIIMKVKLFYRE